jgi:hypothetical protein
MPAGPTDHRTDVRKLLIQTGPTIEPKSLKAHHLIHGLTERDGVPAYANSPFPGGHITALSAEQIHPSK